MTTDPRDDCVAIDTMIVDYLARAMTGLYDPKDDPDDNLRPERVAAARLFFYGPPLRITKTAVREIRDIPDPERRAAIDHDVAIKLVELQTPTAYKSWVETRAGELGAYHGGSKDCRIVAEVEACVKVGGDPKRAVLLTFDGDLRKRLRPHTTVRLLAPSDYWESLNIPRGATPRWVPAATNPIASASWWPC